MKTSFFCFLLLAPWWVFAQQNPNLKLGYAPWVQVIPINNKGYQVEGKIISLEEKDLVLLKNPKSSYPPIYKTVPVSTIDYLKIKGKSNLAANATLGALIFGVAAYGFTKALDQSGNQKANTSAIIEGALIGAGVGMLVFRIRDFKLRININGRQDLYDANKPGMEPWVLKQ